ncbi:MAG: global cell cycle regulator GcrA-like protein [Rhodospirillaceae bacterium]|nr:global cell cycle regulator GcrA-like protein [Rhodospirillaceae bacterium]
MMWTDETIDLLRRLWAEGKSLNEIATALGCSRNAIAGKSRRLGLERRESPIRRDAPPRAIAMGDLKANSCRWTIGDPGKPDFGFCGAPALPGRSYCETHYARVYVQKQSRPRPVMVEDNAA